MQKKNIFTTLVIGLFSGLLGGFISTQWMIDSIQEDLDPGSSEVVYVEESQMITAHQEVAPAVLTILEFVSLEELKSQYYGGGRGFFPVETYDPDRDGLTEIGGGTGFIIDSSGIAITNEHVVADEDGHYVALLDDGTEFDVVIEATDPGNDIAIIRLVADEGSLGESMLGELPFVKLGDSSSLQVGQQLLAIGNALAEYENTTTAGIVSAKGRKIVASDGGGETETLYGLIQTDAAINPGNSGGPLINLAGEVIGINTAVDTEAEGIGFAIPIDDVIPAIESWELYGEILRPVLGVRYVMLTRSRAHELSLDVSSGALIAAQDGFAGGTAVVEGSPADIAGIQVRDVILRADDEDLNFDYTLQDAVLRHQVGDEMVLSIWRDGETLEVIVQLTQVISSD